MAINESQLTREITQNRYCYHEPPSPEAHRPMNFSSILRFMTTSVAVICELSLLIHRWLLSLHLLSHSTFHVLTNSIFFWRKRSKKATHQTSLSWSFPLSIFFCFTQNRTRKEKKFTFNENTFQISSWSLGLVLMFGSVHKINDYD